MAYNLCNNFVSTDWPNMPQLKVRHILRLYSIIDTAQFLKLKYLQCDHWIIIWKPEEMEKVFWFSNRGGHQHIAKRWQKAVTSGVHSRRLKNATFNCPWMDNICPHRCSQQVTSLKPLMTAAKLSFIYVEEGLNRMTGKQVKGHAAARVRMRHGQVFELLNANYTRNVFSERKTLLLFPALVSCFSGATYKRFCTDPLLLSWFRNCRKIKIR